MISTSYFDPFVVAVPKQEVGLLNRSSLNITTVLPPAQTKGKARIIHVENPVDQHLLMLTGVLLIKNRLLKKQLKQKEARNSNILNQ